MKILNFSIKMIIIIIVTFSCSYNDKISITSVKNTNMNQTIDLSTMAITIMEYENEKLYTALDILEGELTSYVYNCELCTGRLACASSLDLSDGTTTYLDDEYGEVYIVASSSKLPCGSIVSFDSKLSDETMYAIVLDRGVIGDDLDLLVWGMEYAIQVGRSNITYSILRSGW